MSFASPLLAQDSDEQLELVIENDKLVFVDKYYTSGFFFNYRKTLDYDFVFNKKDNNSIQINITLGNETYTPTNLQSIDSRDFDRPYAGWLFGGFEIVRIKNNSALAIGLEAGITGEEALSGEIQTSAHEFFNIDIPTWTEQIEFKVLVNLKAEYVLNKKIDKSQAFQYVAESSLGTKDIFLTNSLTYSFGRLNEFNKSSRNRFIDVSNTKEFFGFFTLGHKLVLHNTLIQGSLDFEDTTFTTAKTLHVFNFKTGSILKWRRNTVGFIYNFNTKETPTSTSHGYGTLLFSRNF